jgi:hypothetical protein
VGDFVGLADVLGEASLLGDGDVLGEEVGEAEGVGETLGVAEGLLLGVAAGVGEPDETAITIPATMATMPAAATASSSTGVHQGPSCDPGSGASPVNGASQGWKPHGRPAVRCRLAFLARL